MTWPEDSPQLVMGSLKPESACAIDSKKGGFFDGTQAHETLPFEGRIISLVYYVSNALPKAGAALVKGLHNLGFIPPQRGGALTAGAVRELCMIA